MKMATPEEGPIARLADGAVSIAFVAYCVYVGHLPRFGPITGALVYLAVIAGIGQLIEMPFSYLKRWRRRVVEIKATDQTTDSR